MIDTMTDEQLAETRARTHERINDEIVAPPSRRRRRLPALGLTAAVAGAAAVAAVALAPTSVPTATRPEVATAATVLRGLEPQPLPKLGPGEFYAVRVVQRQAENPAEALDSRYWTDANGKVFERVLYQGDVKREGVLGQVDARNGVLTPAGEGSYPRLPEDVKDVPEDLRRMARTFGLERDKDAEPTTRSYVLAASELVFDPRGTSPEVLRAVWEVLSGLPGMKLVGDVKDPLGRPGKAVEADGDPVNHEGVGVRLIVNPDSGRPLAFIHYRRKDGVVKPWLETFRTEGVTKDADTLP
ncbi:hypothetical protein DVA67_001170 [Solirubrobacter sp. CPCC 204708]|uniref:CU044_5270 family protein n=1 Tax=Solirubrobacter deserti TaxID=2282478 RepID=A0ABT4RDF5_9ACTN|nr:hypothetical protein [Solirubrobacter deserti]MBE2314570.1 hypothetical protein [Solirubrobacter deserti]MDA0136574.1 hypothetical protein [Solirubrobacter deserti]